VVTLDLARAGQLVDRVNARASAVDWRKVLLFVLMAVPFVVGFVAWYSVKSVGWVLSWLYAATVEGWRYAAERGAARAEAG
jgi:hypothetical protein